MGYMVLSGLPRLLAIVLMIGLFLAGMSAGAYAQAVPALWEIEDAGEAYAALRTKAAVENRLAYNEGDNLLEPAEFGCLIGGAISGIALYADPRIISLFVDSTVVAGWSALTYATWGGLIVASVCTVGQLLGPTVVSLYERYISPPQTFIVRDGRL